MFFKRKDKLYEDDEPLQEQLALGDMAQDEFAFGNAESNPELMQKLVELDEEKRKNLEWKSIEVVESDNDFLKVCS